MTGSAPTSMTSRNVRARLLKNGGATALGPLVTIFIQLVSVPVYLRCWGAVAYGEWLMLTAIPVYIALSDLGFGNVAANQMTMQVAAGNRPEALRTFQSAAALISSISTVLAVSIVAAVFSPATRSIQASQLTVTELRIVLLCLCGATLISLQNSLLLAGYRCDGNYALGMLLNNCQRVAEACGSMVVVVTGGSPLRVAVFILIARVLGVCGLRLVQRRKSPWLQLGFRHASLQLVRSMFGPAMAMMAFPVGSALTVQGMLLAVGLVLGPVAVAVFSTMRSLSRLVFQVVDTVRNSVWPELSVAFGRGDLEYARRLHRSACRTAAWMAAAATVFLWIAGPHAYRFWTHGRVTLEPTTFHLLLIGVLANAFWYASSAVKLAVNRHQGIAAAYLLGTTTATLLALVLMRRWGLHGAAMALLAVDVVTGWYVLQTTLKFLDEDPWSFGASLLRLPLHWLKA